MMSIFAREIIDQNKQTWWQEGEQAGEKKGMVDILLGQLQERFGSVPEWGRSKLAEADLDTLKKWSKRIFCAEKIEHVFQ